MGPHRPAADPGPHRALRGVDYEAVFRSGVTPHAVLTPGLVIAAVNDAYLAVSDRSREELLGSDLFDMYVPGPDDERGTPGPPGLRDSLMEVVRSGQPDVTGVLRYSRYDKRTRSFLLRYFTAINIPVLDDDGEVVWILHRVEEVTANARVGTASSPAPADTASEAPHARTRDLVRRNRELVLQASHDREVSRILQEAMLTELPEPDDLHLLARYVPNTAADQVGGDWYDAVALPTGATMIAVGDVVGHDINAAASMGQLRGLLRALAMDRQESPSAVLDRVERVMSGLKLDTLATAVLARIEKPGADGIRGLCWSNAGHPPPILVSEDGTVTVLETANDLPLGAGFGLSRNDHVHPVTRGSILILYTDGLIERRDVSPDEGIGRLVEVLLRHHHLPLERLLDEVIRVAGDAPDDDIAVLAIFVGATATEAAG